MRLALIILFFVRCTPGLLSQPIDRKALVDRHNPVNTKADTLGSLSVGNGRFAFTVDITGLQSFPEAYEKGIPLGTESEWGWHSFPNTHHYKFSKTLQTYNVHGRNIPYSVQLKNKAVDYFRENPHRLQLGNIGLELKMRNGATATLNHLQDIHQELILRTGEIKSHFTLEGIPVDVSTFADPDHDGIAVKIISPLIRSQHLRVRLRFPYPTNTFTDNGDNWMHPEAHTTTIISATPRETLIKHQLDTTTYYVQTTHSPATLTKSQPHYFLITPDPAYTNPRYRGDHPAVLATYGFLPKTQAIDALLMPVQKNRYLPNGHNYQDSRLRLYLPGNGGLLGAVALMCAGYDGSTTPNPGIPKNGKWKVKWEGLQPLP